MTFVYSKNDPFTDLYPSILNLTNYIICGEHAFYCYDNEKEKKSNELYIFFYSPKEWYDQIIRLESSIKEKWKIKGDINNSYVLFVETNGKRKIHIFNTNYKKNTNLLSDFYLDIDQIGFVLIGMGYKFWATSKFQQARESGLSVIYYDPYITNKQVIETFAFNRTNYFHKVTTEENIKHEKNEMFETKQINRRKNGLNFDTF